MTDSVPFWVDDPTSWDRLLIDGENAPGFLDGPGSFDIRWKRKAQKNAGPGINGANLVDQGRELAECTFVLTLLTAKHLARAEAFVRDRIDPAKGAHAVAMSHPILTMHGLSAMYIEEHVGPKKVGPEEYQLTITVSEYKPPPKSTASATKYVVAPQPNALTDTGTGSPLPSAPPLPPNPPSAVPPKAPT